MTDDIVKRQQDFESDFYTWFDAGLKNRLDDNRRRYRMELSDKDEREARGLSCLPSTKSTSVVDSAVERALLDYHADPNALSYTPKAVDDQVKELFTQWLSKTVQYRMEHTFPFFTWHTTSLTAAFSDGLEAAFVCWMKESYENKKTIYRDLMSNQEISKEEYSAGKQVDDLRFFKEDIKEEIVTKDTWWIHQLRPGEDLLWDFKIPYLDINLGQAALIKLYKSVDEVMSMAEYGVIDKIKREEIVAEQNTGRATRFNYDTHLTVANPEFHTLGEYDKVEIRVFFEKVENQWMVTFFLGDKKRLSKPKSVNEVFFNGRQVDKLPVILGTTRIKLWENVGRGLPETIAPIEDEWIDHRNNLNDAAKFAIQGKWRIEPDSDVDIDDLINARAFYGRAGDVELLNTQQLGMFENLRASEGLVADMNELVPGGMSSRVVVPKGTDKTLGATQLALQSANDKLGVQLMVRNQTFMKPLMWLIAQLEFAFETDQTILRIAGKQAGAIQQIPQTLLDGKVGIDISVFDFDVDVQINAGLGSMPRAQKIQNLMQIMQTAQMLGVPVDNAEIFRQVLITVGYVPEQFAPKQPPQPTPPQVEYKLDISTTLPELMQIDPSIIQTLVQKWKEGQVKANTKVKNDGALNELAHNGSPNPMMATSPDMTQGMAAQNMSLGGQM